MSRPPDGEDSAVPGVFTVDVEDWYHPLRRDPATWHGLEDRIWVGTEILLALLAATGNQATFFVLGDVAERHPELVRTILAEGHEVGSHGHTHQPLTSLTPGEFRDDLQRSLEALSAGGAQTVRSFRAPYFSLEPGTHWALEILADQGIQFDSSIFPLKTGYYGHTASPNRPYLLGSVVEVPIALPTVANIRLPLTGGFYSRFFPRSCIVAAVRRARARRDSPVYYIHPWELDPGQPRIPASRFLLFRHYLRLGTTEATVQSVLGIGRWVGIERFLETYEGGLT
ncbi:MAG: polysaccharide deacetylase family protein [Actinomycetota bacterium]|nr:polysaccharide deacetylase family protein [Actinomycetota bacterium]